MENMSLVLKNTFARRDELDFITSIIVYFENTHLTVNSAGFSASTSFSVHSVKIMPEWLHINVGLLILITLLNLDN